MISPIKELIRTPTIGLAVSNLKISFWDILQEKFGSLCNIIKKWLARQNRIWECRRRGLRRTKQNEAGVLADNQLVNDGEREKERKRDRE